MKHIDYLPPRIRSKIEWHGYGCWIWLGPRTADGYGIASATDANGRNEQSAHRVVYALLKGPIPHGRQLHHTCRTPACVNPDHLEPLTPLEHAQHRRYVPRFRPHRPRQRSPTT